MWQTNPQRRSSGIDARCMVAGKAIVTLTPFSDSNTALETRKLLRFLFLQVSDSSLVIFFHRKLPSTSSRASSKPSVNTIPGCRRTPPYEKRERVLTLTTIPRCRLTQLQMQHETRTRPGLRLPRAGSTCSSRLPHTGRVSLGLGAIPGVIGLRCTDRLLFVARMAVEWRSGVPWLCIPAKALGLLCRFVSYAAARGVRLLCSGVCGALWREACYAVASCTCHSAQR